VAGFRRGVTLFVDRPRRVGNNGWVSFGGPAMTERDIFLAVLDLPDQEARAAYLDRVCGTDPALRAKVEALLRSHEAAASFLDQPAVAPAPPADADPGQPPLEFTGPFTPLSEAAIAQGSTTVHRPGIGPGAVIASRYTLQQKVGEGGMGEVWVARQTEPVKREVALKLIKAGMDSRAVLQRFEQERQALALMDHPNIARVLDGGLTPTGQPFFVMELVHGLPLTRCCDEARLTPRQRLELFVLICQAVQHAHQKGLIHRDLKPANILVTLIDGKPVPKVIDFGVAKATAGKLTDESLATEFGAVVGTIEYMAPEQAGDAGDDLDTRADIYSLGVILYELLTGLRPFDSGRLKKAALVEMIRIIREEEPSKPSTRLSTDASLPSLAALRQTEPRKLTALLRGELDWVVMKCLEKQRDRRYETANALARDLERFLADEPVEARPPSRGYRLWKFARRNRIAVTAAGLVLLALLVGIVGTTLGLLEARRQEGIARTETAAKELALEAAQQQRQAAQDNAALAENVLNTMTSELTEKALLTQQAVTADQKVFLQEALKYYRELARAKADGEAARARVAQAAYRVAVIEMRLNRKEESAAAYRTAAELYGRLAADSPGSPAYRVAEASSRHMLGQLLNDLGRRGEAAEQYRAALALREKLTADFPDRPEYRQAVTATRLNMAGVEEGAGPPAARAGQLTDVLAAQERLVREHPDNPGYRDVLAAGRANLALDLLRQGKPEEALEQGRKALVIQEKLVADFPGERDYRQRLYRTHQYLAAVYSARRDPGKAEDHYRQALAIQLRLTDEFPAVPQYRQELAVTRVNLANDLIQRRKFKDGEEQYREAARLFEKLVAELSAERVYREQLLTTYLNLGIILDGTGQAAAAEAVTRTALGHLEKLAAESPAGGRWPLEFCKRCADYAKRLRGAGKPDESLPWYGKAIAAAGKVLRDSPGDRGTRHLLLDSHVGRATTLAGLGRFADALPDWDRALGLSPPEQRRTARVGRALALAHLGRAADAVDEVAGLEKAADLDAGQWYDVACVYALGAANVPEKQAEYAGRSVEALRTAVKAGFKDAARLRQTRALDPLRDREDYQKLLAELEKASPAKP
jgi:tetratricopeptide (TPR) repeat protein/tRNA A-37 threonylcarbamoyl transferase component Bud32